MTPFPPSRPWFYRGAGWSPISRGSDEWGRHTLVLSIPFVVSMVIPIKNCKCDDVDEFRCTFPDCPHLGLVAGGPCPTHDPDWWVDVTEEVSA